MGRMIHKAPAPSVIDGLLTKNPFSRPGESLDTVLAVISHFIIDPYGLDQITDIATHHMVVGWEDCPRPWTVHPDLLEAFRQTVASRVAG
ncbi:MAG: hypothetical protein ACLQCB_01980 [Spirochaetia bacterium]